jgi:hypothetical protein
MPPGQAAAQLREPRPRNCRTPLTGQTALRAAADLADKTGIEPLTCAYWQELGVEAMSLCNHVANQDGLPGGIVNPGVTEIAVPGQAAEPKIAPHCSVRAQPTRSLCATLRRAC